MNLNEMFKTGDIVLVIDWPSKEVPEALTHAGFHVVVRGGPAPTDYSVYELNEGKVVVHLGRPPERANLVFGWIFAGHQLGAGVAAFGAGLSRTFLATYLPAFFAAGALCIVAALSALAISRHPKPEMV